MSEPTEPAEREYIPDAVLDSVISGLRRISRKKVTRTHDIEEAELYLAELKARDVNEDIQSKLLVDYAVNHKVLTREEAEMIASGKGEGMSLMIPVHPDTVQTNQRVHEEPVGLTGFKQGRRRLLDLGRDASTGSDEATG